MPEPTPITDDPRSLPPIGERVQVLWKAQGEVRPWWDYASLKMEDGKRPVFDSYAWHRGVPAIEFMAWMPSPPATLEPQPLSPAETEESVEGWVSPLPGDDAGIHYLLTTEGKAGMPLKQRVRITPVQETP